MAAPAKTWPHFWDQFLTHLCGQCIIEKMTVFDITRQVVLKGLKCIISIRIADIPYVGLTTSCF